MIRLPVSAVLIAAAVFSLGATALAAPPAGDAESQMGSDQVLLAWNRTMLEAIRKQNSAPGLASRNLAILHLAIFDALNATAGRSSADAVGIVSGTAHRCAERLYPSERARFTRLLERCRASASNPVAFAAGVQLGVSAADAMLTERQSDGASRQITYVPSKGIGKWRRSAPKFRPPELPHWKDVKPFALKSADQFRPPPPPDLESEAYAKDWDEVRELGARKSESRTPDQTETAKFWSCFNYTGTPAGHWNEIATQVLPQDQYSLLELARLYALLNVAMADAGIAAWDCKYHYRSWRPIQAIPAAADDGNTATLPDADWVSLLEAPPHPEYVSGHSAFTGAGYAALQHFLGGDKVDFEIHSDSFPGKPRRYSSLSQAAEEIGRSRIYGGIHFQSGNREGMKLGGRVATYVISEALPRLRERHPRP